MNLKLHVTDIDGFQWYKRIESMTVDDMIERLLRTSKPNEQMKMGTALHSILEDPPNEIDRIERDGFTFIFDCDSTISIPQVREIRAEKEYITNGINVVLTGKCDGITANQVDDHKLTFRPNPENYFSSYQWWAYLDIFDADKFRYIIYSARKKGRTVTIYDVSELTVYRYPEMEKDLLVGLSGLVEFIKYYVPSMIKQ